MVHIKNVATVKTSAAYIINVFIHDGFNQKFSKIGIIT